MWSLTIRRASLHYGSATHHQTDTIVGRPRRCKNWVLLEILSLEHPEKDCNEDNQYKYYEREN